MPNVGPPISLKDIVGPRPIFVSRSWGFDPATWAGCCFPSRQTAEKWIGECPEGGFVLWFASHNFQPEVAEKDRGRIFGLYEFVPELVEYTDAMVIHPQHLETPHNYRDDGGFRWPYGLRCIRAWEFVRPDVKTGGRLPDARSLGFEATTDMVPMTRRDFELVNQTQLQEIPVFNREFRPPQLRAPNAVPSFNYIFTCREIDILKRMPGWRPTDILIKPGIAFDVGKRLEVINSHAIARIFDLRMRQEFVASAGSFTQAIAREKAMLSSAVRQGCRVVGQGQQEFLFGPDKVVAAIFAAGATHT